MPPSCCTARRGTARRSLRSRCVRWGTATSSPSTRASAAGWKPAGTSRIDATIPRCAADLRAPGPPDPGMNELDQLERHPNVARLIRSLAQHPPVVVAPEPEMRLAAILLALRARADGEPELLMIKRAEAEGDPWSGHIACPGGRMEDGDNDLAVTAVRETLEETGIDVAKDGRLLGQLDDLSPRTRY